MSQHTYEYPRPALTADLIALRWREGQLQVLLIKRSHDPFSGQWALPGGFVDGGESPVSAAARELQEETGVSVDEESLIEIGAFGAPGRDPRGWTVSVAFVGLVSADVEAKAGDDAAEVKWASWSAVCVGAEALAFDHQEIITRAQTRLSELTLTSPALLALLGDRFRIRHARHLYRQLTTRPISPRVFKAWLRKGDALERVGSALYRARRSIKLPW